MDASINTHRDRFKVQTVLSSEVLRLYYSDADGDSGEANATPSTIAKQYGRKREPVLFMR